jgi:hypothetical protein
VLHASGYVAKCACDVTRRAGGDSRNCDQCGGCPKVSPAYRERKSEHSSGSGALLPAALAALLILLFATAARLSLHHLTPRLIFLSSTLTETQGREVWTWTQQSACDGSICPAGLTQMSWQQHKCTSPSTKSAATC